MNAGNYSFFLCLWIVATLVSTSAVLSKNCFKEPSGPRKIYENEENIEVYKTPGKTDIDCLKVGAPYSRKLNVTIDVTSQDADGRREFNMFIMESFDTDREENKIKANILRCSDDHKLFAAQIQIFDTKDEPPIFIHKEIKRNIKENAKIGDLLIGDIKAEELDKGDFYLLSFEPQLDEKHLYRANFSVNANGKNILDVFLNDSLDYEFKTQHSFIVIARDTTDMTGSCTIVIDVLDVQDTPPVFQNSIINERISEDVEPGSTITRIVARDGDSDSISNQIIYSVLKGGEMFEVDNTTGVVTTRRYLDVDDNPLVVNGLALMTIMATEDNSSEVEQFGVTTSTIDVQIQIDDCNDNLPQFDSSSYSGTIQENAAVGELISIESGGYIIVNDIDRAMGHNQFSFHIEKDGRPWTVFETNIKTGHRQSSILLKLTEEGALSQFAETHVVFQIIAKEIDESRATQRHSSAEMTLWVVSASGPSPVSDKMFDIPSKTAFIVILTMSFVVACLIVTVFICFKRKNKNKSSTDVISKNSKYYISGRNQLGLKDKESKQKDEKDIVDKLHGTRVKKLNETNNTPSENTDEINGDRGIENVARQIGQKAEDIRKLRLPQDPCDVKPYETNNISGLGQGLSNILSKVHEKLSQKLDGVDDSYERQTLKSDSSVTSRSTSNQQSPNSSFSLKDETIISSNLNQKSNEETVYSVAQMKKPCNSFHKDQLQTNSEKIDLNKSNSIVSKTRDFKLLDSEESSPDDTSDIPRIALALPTHSSASFVDVLPKPKNPVYNPASDASDKIDYDHDEKLKDETVILQDMQKPNNLEGSSGKYKDKPESIINSSAEKRNSIEKALEKEATTLEQEHSFERNLRNNVIEEIKQYNKDIEENTETGIRSNTDTGAELKANTDTESNNYKDKAKNLLQKASVYAKKSVQIKEDSLKNNNSFNKEQEKITNF